MKQIKRKNSRTPSRKILGNSSFVSQIPEVEHPLFCLKYLSKDFCITQCDQKEKAAFAEQLHKISQLTWNQLQSASRHGLGSEKINKESIKAAIPNFISGDAVILAFRFDGKKPMVGFRNKNIFHIVWLDRAFKLYDH